MTTTIDRYNHPQGFELILNAPERVPKDRAARALAAAQAMFDWERVHAYACWAACAKLYTSKDANVSLEEMKWAKLWEVAQLVALVAYFESGKMWPEGSSLGMDFPGIEVRESVALPSRH